MTGRERETPERDEHTLDPETVADLEPSDEEARAVAGGSQKCEVGTRPETWVH